MFSLSRAICGTKNRENLAGGETQKGGLLKKMKGEMGKALQGRQEEIFKSCYS